MQNCKIRAGVNRDNFGGAISIAQMESQSALSATKVALIHNPPTKGIK